MGEHKEGFLVYRCQNCGEEFKEHDQCAYLASRWPASFAFMRRTHECYGGNPGPRGLEIGMADLVRIEMEVE